MSSERLIGPRPPRKQDVVSQVLLRRFTIDGQLEARSLVHPNARWKRRSPGAVGYEKDFVRVNAEQVEDVWGAVEARLAPALDEVDSGAQVKPRSDVEAALIDCLALHWARSKGVREAMDRAWDRVRQTSFDDLQGRPELLEIAFYQMTGMHAAGPEALAIANRLIHQGPDDIVSGQHFATRVVEFFHHAQKRLAESHIAVYDLPDGADDLIMSDSPVITSHRGQGARRAGQVALGDLAQIAMPIGPRTAIAAHTNPSRFTITAGQGRALNSFQAEVATKWLYRCPPLR